MIEPLAAIKSCDLFHFLHSQRKIENVKIIPDMLRVGGFRKDHVARLNVPAENDLHVGLAVFLRKIGKDRFVDQPCVAVA